MRSNLPVCALVLSGVSSWRLASQSGDGAGTTGSEASNVIADRHLLFRPALLVSMLAPVSAAPRALRHFWR
jgi:hypothetical protein